jgi:hypothetical protein
MEPYLRQLEGVGGCLGRDGGRCAGIIFRRGGAIGGVLEGGLGEFGELV